VPEQHDGGAAFFSFMSRNRMGRNRSRRMRPGRKPPAQEKKQEHSGRKTDIFVRTYLHGGGASGNNLIPARYIIFNCYN
jgi:hypothetical protein